MDLLFRRKQTGKIANIQLDCTIREAHTYENEITTYQIESGSKITDHVQQQPVQLIVEGFVTDTPIDYSKERLSYIQSVLSEDDEPRTLYAIREILKNSGYKFGTGTATVTTRTEPVLVDVFTSFRQYTNMLIKRVVFPEVFNSMQFTIEFVEANFSDSATVENIVTTEANGKSKNIADRAQDTKGKGKQATEEAESTSTIKKAANGFARLIKGITQ